MPTMTRRTFVASLPALAAAKGSIAFAEPMSALDLIAQQRRQPRIVELRRALERLTSTMTLMITGAHPDDEPSALLAALRYHYGIHPVLFVITRGEGGQNSIGPERNAALGVLRTREMEEASRALDASMMVGSVGPDDPMRDFGFSKDPNATIDQWGRERTLERMVLGIRMHRPDAIMTPFLDVGGQHGHHRAVNVATFEAVEMAADPEAYPDQLTGDITVWNVPKVYQPAYGGGGGVYDDETPPPPATLVVQVPARDPVTGATWPQIGEWSRSFHLTQGMGSWREEPQTEWELNLARTAEGSPHEEADIRQGTLYSLGAISEMDGLPPGAADALRRAQTMADEAVESYTDTALVIDRVAALADAVELALSAMPDDMRAQVGHRLERKLREADQALAVAVGLSVRAWTEGDDITPGETATVTTVIDAPGDVTVEGVEVIARSGLAVEPAEGGGTVSAPAGAALTDPLTTAFDVLGGNGDAFVRVSATVAGRDVTLDVDLEDDLRVLPAASVQVSPEGVLFNTAQPIEPAEMTVTVQNAAPDDLDFDLPAGWSISPAGEGTPESRTYLLAPPEDVGRTRIVLQPMLDGEPAYQVDRFSYPHIGTSVVPNRVSIPVVAVEATLPEVRRVGYISGGNDNVGTWMSRMGLDVVDLTPEQVERGEYRDLQTIVVGIYAFGRRPDLAAAVPQLHDWVRGGGHLVTLYHRPRDGWDPETVPPEMLTIGSPSIRWRVTDPDAEVTVLAPDHPLLTTPNAIGPEDWANWDKERGLYFASDWAPAYTPLLAMSDPGEEPLEGSLLSAEIGEGRHTHTSLILHHQLDQLVPGAFRLLANLVQPAS
ncbi:PIG-L family deacetylase [Wenxinia saemankumensis]|uniref:N-acetylglucosaminyl deacetylase, LmbE family n=1 Tax=Wenxinia saemankumensis TaxID=1447782 RepID=A0A1M6HTA6_9RHOB|nr:PIG-L family deacetylase [Wenxinia saemankumensis]SHJ25452.1 N-acetylglucosaminyl deacetylase, LmbE family [Wenxinia saemankumensis]